MPQFAEFDSDEPLGVRGMWQLARVMLNDHRVDSREIRAAVLLFATSMVGTNVRRLREFTGIPHRDIERVSYNLRANGLWLRDGTFHAPWLDDEDTLRAEITLALYVLVALGDIEAVTPEEFQNRMAHGVPWRQLVPRRDLQPRPGQQDLPEPFWVRNSSEPSSG